jgi:Rhodopirellula transposase DDE domain
MNATTILTTVQEKYRSLTPIMDERMRRRWAASEAIALGWGGITLIAQATGLSPVTIRQGIAELKDPTTLAADEAEGNLRIRQPGGGRKRLSESDRTLRHDLEALVDPATRGHPQSPLLWTCKSTRNLAEALAATGHEVSHQTVARLLQEMDYSLQVNRKTREGASHPDRNAQFGYIAKQVRTFQRRGQPVVSVDTKKKELIGDFKNGGHEWQPEGEPEEVRCKDFKDKQLGKVAPYGIYDLTENVGWVSVGIDHDTAQFATETLRRWWQNMGRPVYPQATELLVTADGGGSNGSRTRLWKVELQTLANQLGLRISVCHFPPGTSKWNKIEHRMFCHITENWRGRPLVSRAAVVNLIGNTKTKGGLRIQAELDTNSYPLGIKVTDEELAAVKIKKHSFHGDWNYTIAPSL